ncbi:prepilin-type N-terminal cleavage/methylation domain-containing protein [Nostoc sp. UHCC 0870]|uniref:prepilin-type N-terminal cleavage/methylation domain-containing protein n=1 Tax=Nostoc sp. UHCC 0870 TaxID=2914041 RepID=UPI0030DC23B7|nr:prepilin-type N-terminal cleavage/methylation domain-containing protein [Nostoc sp. UHCC 0870]
MKAQQKIYLHTTHSSAGFSLVEMLAVIVMIGVLAAIAAPNWIAFVNRQRASKANDVVLSAIRDAQNEATKQKRRYSVSFKTDNNIPQVAIYPHPQGYILPSDSNIWRPLGENLDISPGQIVIGTNITSENTSSSSVTYASNPTFTATSKPQTITFDHTGALDLLVKTKSDSITSVQTSKLGTKGLIVSVAVAKPGNPTQESNVKRCVIIKTILGTTKTARDAECS